MLIKVALGLALFAGLGMVVWTIKSKASAAAGAVSGALDAVNPTSTDNIVYSAANGVYETVLPSTAENGRNADGSWTIGGWIYDVTHPGTAANVRAVTGVQP
jgi:hypothetical protein